MSLVYAPTRVRDSRELGLVLAQQLLQVEHLHYGLWREGVPVTLGNLPAAQDAYNTMLLEAIGPQPQRILEVGCGTGVLLAQMLKAGHSAEGVSPSEHLSRQIRRRVQAAGFPNATLHESRFEDLNIERLGRYDIVLYSESFQYISMKHSLSTVPHLLNPGGRLILCDFFKRDLPEDGVQQGGFGGGHPWKDFAPLAQQNGFVIERDEDITARITPNLALLNDVLENRLVPVVATIDGYLQERKPWLRWLIAKLAGKRLEKARLKYLSGQRTPENFAKYKTYRLVVLRNTGNTASA